ncbi:MAG: histidine phosphatase family protein [Chloroflexota bacterium]
MHLFFIRHGQSVNNALWDQGRGDEGRVPDPELTENGVQQATLVGQFFGQHHKNGVPVTHHNYFDLTHLYCSLMVRAIDTANAVAETTGLTPVVWEGIHETGGIWNWNEAGDKREGFPGKNRADFEARYPNLILPDGLDEQGWWNRPFEDVDQFSIRAKAFVKDLFDRHGGTDDRVAIVSHGGFYNWMMRAFLNLPIERPTPFWLAMNNTAITRIDFGGNDPMRVAYQNRVDFLPPELVT